MLTLGILCSGRLGLSTLKHIVKNNKVKFVLTDKKSINIITFSKENNIPIFAGNPRQSRGFNFIKTIKVDIIVSINYLFLIEEDIIEHPKKFAFNIHGSLLPKYRGRAPHIWAIINGEKRTGITAHIIDANCDTGDIINQFPVEIEPESTGADILKKYTELYIPLVDKVLLAIENNDLKIIPQDNSKATFFGKRTPDDGEINWNWNKENIRNWVRAQAYPYPGAFTFLDNKKVIIDKVSTEKNNRFSAENGEIIKLKPRITVKVKDGLVILEKIRSKNYNFNIGNRFTNEDRK